MIDLTSKLSGFGFCEPSIIDSTIDAIHTVIEDLNGEFENYSISDFKKAYKDKVLNELNERVVFSLRTLIEKLQNLNQEVMSSQAPEEYFLQGWGNYEPNTPLYALKSKLLDFNDLLDFITMHSSEEVKICEVFVNTKKLLADKVDILTEIIEDYGKFIFATKLKSLAKKKGLTQEDIAKKLQVRQQTVSEWYCQKTYPSIDKAIQLALLLTTSVDYLVRPDVREIDLSDNYIAREIGLTADNTEILRQLHSSKNSFDQELINTLNLCISQIRHGSDTNIISAIGDYLKLPHQQTMYVVTDEALAELNLTASTSQTLKDCMANVKSFIDATQYLGGSIDKADSYDNLMLQTVSKVLTRIKDGIK